VQLLPDSEQGVNEFAAEALGRIGPPASDAVAALAASLRCGGDHYRAVVAQSLGRIRGSEEISVGALLSIISDDSASNDLLAVTINGMRGFPGQRHRIVPALEPFVSHNDLFVRQMAKSVINDLEKL
jgi:hypothetical protein